MLGSLVTTALAGGINVTFKALVTADKVASISPVYRLARDRTLDRLFGPEEILEYASTTAPNRPAGF